MVPIEKIQRRKSFGMILLLSQLDLYEFADAREFEKTSRIDLIHWLAKLIASPKMFEVIFDLIVQKASSPN